MQVVIEEELEGPVYVFLELTRFFQGHKRMVSSVPKAQLLDQNTRLQSLREICQGAFTYANFDVDKKEFKDSEMANPCGLMSRFFPQDKFFNLVSLGDEGRLISEKIRYRGATVPGRPLLQKGLQEINERETVDGHRGSEVHQLDGEFIRKPQALPGCRRYGE